MAIVIHCPKCSAEHRVADRQAGQRVRCPGCKGAIVVPGGPEAAASPSAAANPAVQSAFERGPSSSAGRGLPSAATPLPTPSRATAASTRAAGKEAAGPCAGTGSPVARPAAQNRLAAGAHSAVPVGRARSSSPSHERPCPECGKAIAYLARRCRYCKVEVPPPQDAALCEECGTILPPSAQRCSKCGKASPDAASQDPSGSPSSIQAEEIVVEPGKAPLADQSTKISESDSGGYSQLTKIRLLEDEIGVHQARIGMTKRIGFVLMLATIFLVGHFRGKGLALDNPLVVFFWSFVFYLPVGALLGLEVNRRRALIRALQVHLRRLGKQ